MLLSEGVTLKLRKYSHLKFGLVLSTGALISSVLCVQCVRTYLYADAVLVPQQAERDAERQVGALSAAARSGGITNPSSLGPIMERILEPVSDRVIWMRVLELNGNVIAQAGTPERAAQFPARWWERVTKRESLGSKVDTRKGKAWLFILPLRLPPTPRSRVELGSPNAPSRGPDDRHVPYALEIAISHRAIAASFAGLRYNLIVGLIASIALIVSVVVIGLRAPHYVRGKYLESELQLARRVQSDLQPKPQSVSAHIQFAARAVAADHVGGDFYDIFGAESGEVAIVLGDVSGKGVPAALLASVLHGSIRSSTQQQHEVACERINRMLCERAACERFATLFWGVFDRVDNQLRYVNAGHVSPMLVRRGCQEIERLSDGGPVLGLLPDARYSAGIVNINEGDKLIVYSDGITESFDRNEEQFGEARLTEIISDCCNEEPQSLCDRIAKQVTAFASAEAPQDDRTLIVVEFAQSTAAFHEREPIDIAIASVV